MLLTTWNCCCFSSRTVFSRPDVHELLFFLFCCLSTRGSTCFVLFVLFLFSYIFVFRSTGSTQFCHKCNMIKLFLPVVSVSISRSDIVCEEGGHLNDRHLTRLLFSHHGSLLNLDSSFFCCKRPVEQGIAICVHYPCMSEHGTK